MTLPPDATNIAAVFFEGDPLATFVLPDVVAARLLGTTVSVLQFGGLSTFIYPLNAQLLRTRLTTGAFGFTSVGPPGTYTILESTNLVDWVEAAFVTNSTGGAIFTDETVQSSAHRFYRALKL